MGDGGDGEGEGVGRCGLDEGPPVTAGVGQCGGVRQLAQDGSTDGAGKRMAVQLGIRGGALVEHETGQADSVFRVAGDGLGDVAGGEERHLVGRCHDDDEVGKPLSEWGGKTAADDIAEHIEKDHVVGVGEQPAPFEEVEGPGDSTATAPDAWLGAAHLDAIDAEPAPVDCVPGICGRVFGKELHGRFRGAVRLEEEERRVGLGVAAHVQDPLPLLGEPGAQVCGEGGLPHPSLAEHDDADHSAPPSGGPAGGVTIPWLGRRRKSERAHGVGAAPDCVLSIDLKLVDPG